MKLALLGGTFNPLHNGHLNLARVVKEEFNYDKILFVPSYIPAHKDLSGDISAEERLHMLKISIEDLKWADSSDCEILRKGVSYTIDTLKYVREHYDIEGKPGLIIGDDLAEGFSGWRDPHRILELADLIIAHRLYEHNIPLNFPHRYADNKIFTLSSSEIRHLISTGRDSGDLIPVAAARFIVERELYIAETGKN